MSGQDMQERDRAVLRHDHIFLGGSHDAHERRTRWVVALTALMMVGEVVAGTLFGSMALLADHHQGGQRDALFRRAVGSRPAPMRASNASSG